MQTFAAFLWHGYNLCHLLNSGRTLLLLCAAPALTARVISDEEKSQCHVVRRHFSQTKKIASALSTAQREASIQSPWPAS